MEHKYSAWIIGTGRIGFTLGFDKKREQPASHIMACINNTNIRINCVVTEIMKPFRNEKNLLTIILLNSH